VLVPASPSMTLAASSAATVESYRSYTIWLRSNWKGLAAGAAPLDSATVSEEASVLASFAMLLSSDKSKADVVALSEPLIGLSSKVKDALSSLRDEWSATALT